MGELQEIVPLENKVILLNGELKYDYLVLATGTESNFFGIENIKKNALPMKTVNDALELRNFLFLKMEEAIISKDEDEIQKCTTIVITGGGPTGVELAGMLAEMRNTIFEKDYPELGNRKVKIYLVDGSLELLSPMSMRAQEYTLKTLQEMGVEVQLNKRVKDYIDECVIFEDGASIPSKLLIWAAGITASIFEGIPKECFGPGRRLLVNEINKVHGIENIYAVGDTCLQQTDEKFPKGHPQLAQVAIQQGLNLSRNFNSLSKNESLTAFSYWDKGSMAIIGRSKAAADLPKPKITFLGWFAWAMWLFVHLFSLISYRNRFKTMINWTTSYFTKDQSMRLIVNANSKKMKKNT
jgi:NADH dehydrogenase